MEKLIMIGKSFGTSMVPLINPGDKLFIRKVKKNDIKIGDIIVFYFQKKCISHRVIFIKNNIVTAKGDNVLFSKEIVTCSEILGKIVKIDGKYGTIYFENAIVRFFQFYFLLRSLIFLYAPFYLYKPLLSMLRGRKLIVQCIVK